MHFQQTSVLGDSHDPIACMEFGPRDQGLWLAVASDDGHVRSAPALRLRHCTCETFHFDDTAYVRTPCLHPIVMAWVALMLVSTGSAAVTHVNPNIS